jgi:hypothetical protein
VENGVSGYRFSTSGELLDLTGKAIRDPKKREQTGRAARRQGGDFTRAIFAGKVRSLFKQIAEDYASGKSL